MNNKQILILLISVAALSSFITYREIQKKKIPQPIEVTVDEKIKKGSIYSDKFMESSPFVWNDQLYFLISDRNDVDQIYSLAVYDKDKKKVSPNFGEGLSLASAYVENGTLYIFATKNWAKKGESQIFLITSDNLKDYAEPRLLYSAKENQRVFNTSVTKNTKTNNYVMAIEVDEPGLTHFTMRFLTSSDLENWNEQGILFGKDVYVACPAIRYVDGNYYLLYGAEYYFDPNCSDCKRYIVKISKSSDLISWDTSIEPVVMPSMDGSEGLSTVDLDLTQYDGSTYIHYSIGDQDKWAKIKEAKYEGTLSQFLQAYFLEGLK